MKIYSSSLSFNLLIESILILSCLACVGGQGELKRVERLTVFASEEAQVAIRYIKKKGSIAEAIRILRRKVKLKDKKNHIRYRLMLARIYLIQGKSTKAEFHAKAVEKIQFRNVQAKIILANVAFRKGFFARAKLILEYLNDGAFGNREERAEIYNLLAGVSLKEKDDQASLKWLKVSIGVKRNYFPAHMNLGLIYLKHQEYRLAMPHFDLILNEYPDNYAVKLHRAICFAGLKDYEKASTLYDELLKEDAYNPTLLFNLAVLEFRRKNFKDSIEYLKDYVDEAPVRYLAKRAAKRIIHEIQLENVQSIGITDEAIEELNERIDEIESSGEDPVSFDKNAEISSGFVFTGVGSLDD